MKITIELNEENHQDIINILDDCNITISQFINLLVKEHAFKVYKQILLQQKQVKRIKGYTPRYSYSNQKK
jgi:hypothetical protein